MSDSKELVRRLRQVASELKTAAKWHGSGLAVDATKNDYLYELYCYFRAAMAAAPHFNIRVSGAKTVAKGGKRAAKWPKKPGHKKNFSFLSLLDVTNGDEVFQLCPGIKIRDKNGKSRAPDLNLLSASAPDNPTHLDVVSIWDAKFTSKGDTKLPDIAVSDFVFTYQQLASPKAPKEWLQKVADAEWQQSGLLTNALPSTEPDAVLTAYGISETSGFPDGPPTTRP